MIVKRLGTIVLMISIVGCTTLPSGAEMHSVNAMVEARLGKDNQGIPDPFSNTPSLICTQPSPKILTVEQAVNIALHCNAAVRSIYAGLGVAEADLVQAESVPNPHFSFARLKRGNDISIETKWLVPIVGVLLYPLIQQQEKARFQQATWQTAIDVLRVAYEVRQAYFSALAAKEMLHYMHNVQLAAEAGGQLADALRQTGSWSALRRIDQHRLQQQAMVQTKHAETAYQYEREKLARLLGMVSSSAFELPERLPDLPTDPRTFEAIETVGLSNRLDLLMAQHELEALAASLALTRTTRFINVLDVSYLNQRDSQSPAAQGYELEFQIPLFDWGNAKRARSEQMYKEAVYRVAQQVIQARSEMRVAYHQYRAAYDVANYYQKERIPLQKQISNEKLLRYNGMLLSVFDLLEDAREQMLVVVAAIEAKRDFWLADTQLDISLSAYSAEGVSAPSILSEGDVRGK